MTTRGEGDQTAREARVAAIRACRRCDPFGWLLGPDGLAADTARRCDHGSIVAPTVRDVTEPLHERPDTRL